MTKIKKSLPIELLRQLVRMDEATGFLYWLPREPCHFTPSATRTAEGICNQWNGRCAGKRAFKRVDKSGYLTGIIFYQRILTHRLVFALSRGCWPVNEIDHINGKPKDNRPANLRDVPHGENQKNQALPTTNSSGAMGVMWNKTSGKWKAYIKIGGKNIHLGFHAEKSAAIAARRQAEVSYGFHENHGRAAERQQKQQPRRLG